MHQSSITSRRGIAMFALVANLVLVSGCSGSSVAPLGKNAGAAARPMSNDGYSFQTVDYPGAADTQVTGINASGEVIGNYTTSYSGTNTTWNSFVATPPYSSSDFKNITFPFANDSNMYMYAISDDAQIKVGYVLNPNEETGMWGAVLNDGLWSLIRRRSSEEKCGKPNWNHELLGYDSGSMDAVGAYTDNNYQCDFRPFEVKPGDNGVTTKFNIPSSWLDTEATGIASNGDIVGTTASGAGVNTYHGGWFLANGSTGTPQVKYCCGTINLRTWFTGITGSGSSTNDVIVGWYSGAGLTPNGLIYRMGSSKPWATVDDTQGVNGTVINGINATDDISGWYRDGTGTYHGFVGTPGAHLRKPR